ncbi:hypothetical protein Agabi119p4_6079 [Agaricus bisporus var. burnettii]|uniref:Uncharacterized protein n=1 Tax=Agaricus bisporus var. burnettii TaxID=192524 RepID=A0A8H7F135_AGABI|nr:hypothetical protein Agabi119p4_6079 [Agaricus bisporus var. burnettii]
MANTPNLSLQIQKEYKSKLLPELDLSIHTLLQYDLPPINYTDLGRGTESAFFSISEPKCVDDEAITQLQYLPIPSPKHVRELVTLYPEAVEAGFQSLTYHHVQPSDITQDSEGNYPLWVITFWEQVVVIKDVVRQWLQCRDWLTTQVGQKKSSGRSKRLRQARVPFGGLAMWDEH